MTCHQVTSENIIERYLVEELDEPTRDAFELHYFACESCLATLQTVQTLQPVLATFPKPTAKSNNWPWLLAAAAALAIAYFVWPQPPPPQFAAIQPPPYTASLLRGTANDQSSPAFEQAAFDTAMALYSARQYAPAAAALSALSNPTPQSQHFAALSLLLADQPAAALPLFDKIIALGPQSPFEEEARFHRAHALLRLGRLTEAKTELDRVINLRGDYEAPAKKLQTPQ